MICVARDERSKRPLTWQRIPWGLCPLKCTPGKKQKPCIVCADRARRHLCCVDAASRSTNEGTSYVLCGGAVGARYDRHRSFPSSQDQRSGTNWQRTRTWFFCTNRACGASSDTRSARVHGPRAICAHSRSRRRTTASTAQARRARNGCLDAPGARHWDA